MTAVPAGEGWVHDNTGLPADLEKDGGYLRWTGEPSPRCPVCNVLKGRPCDPGEHVAAAYHTREGEQP